jgi:hypothetical protein
LQSEKMSEGVTILLFIIILFVLIFSLVRASAASYQLLGTSTDPDIVTARDYLLWLVSLLWIAIGLIIVGIVLLFVFGLELVPYLGSLIFYLLFAFIIIAVITVGVVASIAAQHINNSTERDKYAEAYSDSVQAAVASLLTLSLIVIGFIVYYVYGSTSEVVETAPEVTEEATPVVTPVTATPETKVAVVPETKTVAVVPETKVVAAA